VDFGNYPPEINSARMYSGAGSGPMLAAAEAWDTLAAELHSVANSYQSVISGLTAGPWQGPASASMSVAAASYTTWLQATAAQAEETAAQAKSAAAAYQSAFTATVSPAMVAANRTQLMTLIATNVFGRNTQAIAANEAQYGQMWAQDVAAMYGYAASSSSATQLTTFNPPQQNTNPGGTAGQSAAVTQATGTAAGNAQNAVSSIQQAFSAVPNALQGASAAAPAATDPLSTIANLISIFVDLPAGLATFAADIPLGSLGVVALPFDVVGALTGTHTDKIVSGWNGEQAWPGEGSAPVKPFPAPLLNLQPGTVPAPKPSVAAGLAEANSVGGLSVPPTWTIATPAVRPTAVTLPVLPDSAAGAVAGESMSGASGSALSEMALAGMAGRAMAGTVGTSVGRGGKAPKGTGAAARTKDTSSTGDRAAQGDTDNASQSKPRTVVTGVAAELREFAKLRDEGILTDQEYTEQKNRLLGR
jgi:PPE-repeat protein